MQNQKRGWLAAPVHAPEQITTSNLLAGTRCSAWRTSRPIAAIEDSGLLVDHVRAVSATVAGSVG
jgi:hypothetical protein